MRIRASDKRNQQNVEIAKRLILSGATEVPANVRGDPRLIEWAVHHMDCGKGTEMFGVRFVAAMETELCKRLKSRRRDGIFGFYHELALAKMNQRS